MRRLAEGIRNDRTAWYEAAGIAGISLMALGLAIICTALFVAASPAVGLAAVFAGTILFRTGLAYAALAFIAMPIELYVGSR